VCLDHPAAAARAHAFLDACARTLADCPGVIAWDVWNETRWAVEGDGYLCHCDASVALFRDWLAEEYGDLAGLNRAWRRRYSDWADVHPGKRPGLPYTDLMEHQRFLEHRALVQVTQRRDVLAAAGAKAPLVAHSGEPSIGFKGFDFEQAVSRGNDFQMAPVLDGYGCSHFPVGHGLGDFDFGWRVETTASAVRDGGEVWVSELQGGSARNGIEVQPPVRAVDQQRWIWGALGRGVDRIIFWQWRDEVFGRESGGYGISGEDGFALERLDAMRRTSAAITEHRALLDGYRREDPSVFVVFEADSHRLDWAQNGVDAGSSSGSIIGWLRALERRSVRYAVRDSRSFDDLDNARVVILPWPLAVKPELVDRLADWVRAGGTLITEPDLASVDRLGFFRSAAERSGRSPFPVEIVGRRPVDGGTIEIETRSGVTVDLQPNQWREPVTVEGVLRPSARVDVGSGTVYFVGSMVGLGRGDAAESALSELVGRIVGEAGAGSALVTVEHDGSPDHLLQWTVGQSGDNILLFVTVNRDGADWRLVLDEVGTGCVAIGGEGNGNNG
jgi:beta-galactosidase